MQVIAFFSPSFSQKPKADSVYEEIKNSSASASGPNDIYALAQLGTNPNAHPPTAPGIDPTYSTVQSPAGHSECLNYASVTFRAETTSYENSVTLRKNELSCDYSTVNYRA